MASRFRIADYFSLVKINHTIFSLPFALIGFSLGAKEMNGQIDWWILLLILLCVLFARNAAMGFNRYADRIIDGKNPRTAQREIPSRVIQPWAALLFVLVNALLFMATTWFLNLTCFILSPVALVVILGYSLTKRFTHLSHVVLGLSLSLAPIGAYLAITGHFSLLPVLFSLIVIFWVTGFDILYALQDEEFDKKEHLKSFPARVGKRKALVISALFHVCTIGIIILTGFQGGFHLFYWIGALIFSLLLTYEHAIVKPTDISRVNLAFATLNGTASVLYAVFVILDLFLNRFGG
ncbi:MAG TPA: UbiA-like polyprenyltransferase [Bacteroidales bacterium]|nr:UbiA-like polyprenyltransferase [Bacteroidales bacterium]HPS49439.1 UbiA-like polyprenyltransferase [Bacteroidales bacterium]